MDELLHGQYLRYPRWQAADVLKLLYQRHCGCGHFAPQQDIAQERLAREWRDCPAEETQPLWEDLGGGYARLHLSAAKAAGISMELALRLFLRSATAPSAESLHALESALRRLQPESLGIDPADWQRCLAHWHAQGCPPPGHSDAYRAAYMPAYRVISTRYARWLPLLQATHTRLDAAGKVVLAIDGRSGSGKSDLAACLREIWGASVAHMDDFFLPAAKKTPERLAQPGGNVDIERFCAEVLEPMRAGQPLCYRPYSCHLGKFQEPVALPETALTVVEGVYSLHPAGAFPYDLTFFLSVPPQVQRDRILARNGPEMLKRFTQEWIPLEERYFAAFRIAQRADVCFDTQACRVVQPCQV